MGKTRVFPDLKIWPCSEHALEPEAPPETGSLGSVSGVSQDVKTWKDERGSINSESHNDGGEREEMV